MSVPPAEMGMGGCQACASACPAAWGFPAWPKELPELIQGTETLAPSRGQCHATVTPEQVLHCCTPGEPQFPLG